jgi:D-alanyl-D-alanine carboxypeptidase
VLALLLAAAGPAGAQQPPAPLPPPPPPEAWIAVDLDTGAVIDQGNARTPLRVASAVKVVTALVALERLKPDSGIRVSARAEGMPARKINMKAGQVWDLEDTVTTMLLVSANDAAVALAEKVGGGSLDGWYRVATRAAARLGMEDEPKLYDPAGLDDEFSHRGGSLISARDLAIGARAAWEKPLIRWSVVQPEYRFTGGDQLPHRLRNHNLLLQLYPGANGMKTGYTKRAGRSLVATATRDGRSMLAVVVNAADPYRSAGLLLDKGFGTAVRKQEALDHLPEVVDGATRDPTTTSTAVPMPSAVVPVTGGDGSSPFGPVALLVVGGLPALFVLRRRSRAMARAAARAAAER